MRQDLLELAVGLVRPDRLAPQGSLERAEALAPAVRWVRLECRVAVEPRDPPERVVDQEHRARRERQEPLVAQELRVRQVPLEQRARKAI